MQRLLRSMVAILGGLLGFVVVSGPPSVTTASATQPLAVKVVGNELVNASNQPMRLIGMDRSGTEYACVQGFGIFDGPSDAASVAAMASWHADAVRVPLNEDCWLGINGVNPSFSGANYRSAIENYVQLLNNAGMIAILDLHWNAPGSTLATGQQVMADADHSIALWSSVATAFKADPGVVFDLYNEPHDISWSCWRNGCTTSAGWQAAGMQQMLNAVRNAGATQPVMIAGLNWANDLSGWLANEPSDPLHQLVASAHLYNFTGCSTSTCWNQTLVPVAASVPLVTGELGENDCSSGFINAYMSWADSVGVSYLGWAWDTSNCSSGPALVTSYSGSPTAFGAGLQTHMAALAARSPIFAPAGSPAPPPPDSGVPQLNFANDATSGWRVEWGSGAAVAPGAAGLSLQMTGAGFPGFSGTSGLSSLGPGDTVTDEIDNPSGASLQVVPFTQDSGWAVHFAPATTLSSGWNSVTWTVPPQSGMNAIGLQVDDPNNWSGQLVLGSVGWTVPQLNFANDATSGWRVEWGSGAAVAPGAAGLSLQMTGAGFPGFSGTSGLSSLGPGDTVTDEIDNPSGASLQVVPFTQDSGWAVHFAPATTLSSGWNSVTWTVPPQSGMNAIGLQVDDPNNWSGQLVLGSVGW